MSNYYPQITDAEYESRINRLRARMAECDVCAQQSEEQKAQRKRNRRDAALFVALLILVVVAAWALAQVAFGRVAI